MGRGHRNRRSCATTAAPPIVITEGSLTPAAVCGICGANWGRSQRPLTARVFCQSQAAPGARRQPADRVRPTLRGREHRQRRTCHPADGGRHANATRSGGGATGIRGKRCKRPARPTARARQAAVRAGCGHHPRPTRAAMNGQQRSPEALGNSAVLCSGTRGAPAVERDRARRGLDISRGLARLTGARVPGWGSRPSAIKERPWADLDPPRPPLTLLP